ncbi:MAG: MAPEG family protein [Caldimonas sp.]
MRNPAILYPLFALAGWTLLVLLLIPLARVRSVRQREIGPEDFRYGESAKVPGNVSIPNRNYMNLLELPMLFYVVGIVLYVTGGASTLTIVVAWAFVALRVVHSVIHLTYNHVLHRLAAFSLASAALGLLWIVAAAHLAAAAP